MAARLVALLSLRLAQVSSSSDGSKAPLNCSSDDCPGPAIGLTRVTEGSTGTPQMPSSSASTSLQWPFDVETYSDSEHLSLKSSHSYVIAAPVFPPALSGGQYGLAITIQCSQCGSVCMSLSSSSSLSCDSGLHICDTDLHSCSDAMPTSSTQQNSYTLSVANQNFIHSLDYDVTIRAECPGGGTIDYTVCAPVLGSGLYPTACVFYGNPGGVGQGVYFGVDGCSCRQTDNQGFSECWDGSHPTTDDFSYGIQECGPYCPSPPSNSHSASYTSSISVTRSFTSSRSRSSSATPTVSVSNTQSPSPPAAPQNGSQTGFLGLSKKAVAGIIGAVAICVGALLAVAVWCYCRKRKSTPKASLSGGRGEGSLNADYSAALLDSPGHASRV